MSHFQAQHSTHQTASGSAMPPHVDADGALSALDEMRQRAQWVCWKYVPQPLGNDGKPRKPKKPPIDPKTGGNASHGDPGTWGAYEQARKFEQANKRTVEGIGYVFTADDSIVGIDLDNCRNPETGVLEPWAQQIIDLAETYAEVSVSGTGVHLLARGKRDRAFKCDKANVEIYQKDRYFVWTANHIESTPTSILPADETIDILIKRVEDFRVAESGDSEGSQKISQGVGDAKFSKNKSKDNFWDRVNSAALSNLDAWVKDLFPKAKYQLGTQAWRVSSKDLGRDFDEDLSIHPSGISDFGEEKTFNAIKLVQKYGNKASAKGAAFWLCEKLGVAPKDLGWEDRATTKEFNWQEPRPIPQGLTPVDPFNASDLLPRPFAKWIEDISERMQCPPEYIAVAAVVSAGATLGAKATIHPKQFDDWQVAPNNYGMVIGDPSSMKSPGMNQCIGMIKRLDVEAMRVSEEEQKIYRKALKEHEALMKAYEAALAKNAKEGGNLSFLEMPEEPQCPVERTYVAQNTTYEKLADILEGNPAGVLVFRDELMPLLETLRQEKNAEANGLYLTGWNGYSDYKCQRMTRRRTYIPNACISLLGAATPDKLTNYLKKSFSGIGSDDGMIQRFGLLVWPDQSLSWENHDRYPDKAIKEEVWKIYQRLDQFDAISCGAQKGDFDKLPFFNFDEAAQSLFNDWHRDNQKLTRSNQLPSMLKGHFVKHRELVGGLALLFNIIEFGRGPVREHALARAIAWSDFLQPHARRAYSCCGEQEALTADLVLKKIRSKQVGTTFTARDITQRKWAGLTDNSKVQEALDLLENNHWIASELIKTSGRPKLLYTVNPMSFA